MARSNAVFGRRRTRTERRCRLSPEPRPSGARSRGSTGSGSDSKRSRALPLTTCTGRPSGCPWEVFFVTRRPETSGETSQRQTQRWLVAQGFELPSVLVVNGSRGRVADALALDALVDDLPSHCVDVKSESKAKPILMLRQGDDAVSRKARKLGIEVVTSMRECLGLLEGMSRRRGSSLVSRLARRVGLSS